MNITDIKQLFIAELNTIYDSNESVNLMWWAIQELTSKQKKELLSVSDLELDEKKLQSILSELKIGNPIQYIFNKTYFFDLEFFVNENVLIPRPETEELVQWILDDINEKENLNIIDLCTGSGCIAVSLKKNKFSATISAVDISEKAIDVATQNATQNKAEIIFKCVDVLNYSSDKMFDVIASNPPYVCNKEKALMHKNVLDYEPHLALFVEDSDALIFYKAIANFGLTNLNANGTIYLEINESLAAETSQLFYDLGYTSVEVKKDLNDKNRMMKVQK